MRMVPDRIRRFGFAVLMLVLGAAVVTISVVRAGDASPITIFFFVILLSAWYGRIGPGLLTTA